MCKTHYVISEDSKADRIHLTKTRDLNHCPGRVYLDIGLAGYIDKCAECQSVSAIFLSLIVSLTKPKLLGLKFFGFSQCSEHNI